jgi:hypothetical protein
MSSHDFSDLSFPASSDLIFDKVLWTDWYDGMTAGLALRSRVANAFKLDILAWSSGQTRRIFALSPFNVQKFNLIVMLLAGKASPTWPKWDPEWPSGTPEKEILRAELKEHLKGAGSPKYVIASEASFETIYALKQIDDTARQFLPADFNGIPFRENYDYWREYLEI